MHHRSHLLLVAAALIIVGDAARATEFNYTSVVTQCSGTCDSFTAFDVGSTITGHIFIDVEPTESFGFADVGDYAFEVMNPNAPLEPYDGGNLTTANPLPIVPATASIRSGVSGLETGGDTDAIGELVSGHLLFEFILPPFSINDTWITFNLADDFGEICEFFMFGCIPGATQFVLFEGEFTVLDSDGDGVENFEDNCTAVPNPSQADTNSDGIGNACDADITNDCDVNFGDLAELKAAFTPRPYNPDADFDGDGNVNFGDLAFMKSTFFNGVDPGPGPSGLPNACTPLVFATERFGDGGVPDSGGWSTGFNGSVVSGGGEGGDLDHAMAYGSGSQTGLSGFHLLHPSGGAEPNPLFRRNYLSAGITHVSFRARHSGVGDTVVLRAVLFDSFADGNDWAQTIAAVTISNTATSWQTYTLSLRASDLMPGGQNGVPVNSILSFVEQIGLRHDPLGTGPGNPSQVSPTTVWFDDISLLEAGGVQ